MINKLSTKFGNISLDNDGYYKITSKKEGNMGKLLHRVIWEDFYGCNIPKGYHIHHLNKNKLDNRIQNLQCCEAGLHSKFHNTGIKTPHSIETKQKMSELRNNSGYYNVGKVKNSRYAQGFFWRYRYYKHGKRMELSSVDIEKLKEKVINQGLHWEEYL